MYSRLLTDIEARLRNSSDSVSWARDICRAASHFARQGQAELALKSIQNVRQHFGKRLDAEVACWLLLAEGMQHFFQERQAEAYDRFRGAYGMAIGFEAKRASPSCAAWMAHIEFNENRFDSAIRFIEEALTTAGEDDHQARARACLVLADSYHFAGNFKKARPWYERTRLHATSEGDGATLSAFFHNLAALRATNVKLADAFGVKHPEDTKQASMEAASAFNYDTAIGTASFQLAIPMLRAQLLVVEGKYEQALVELATLKVEGLRQRLRAPILVDRAWCLVQIGELEHVKRCALEAVAALTEDVELDDRAYVLARLSKVQEAMAEEYVPDCAARAQAALVSHRSFQDNLEVKLDGLVATLDALRVQ